MSTTRGHYEPAPDDTSQNAKALGCGFLILVCTLFFMWCLVPGETPELLHATGATEGYADGALAGKVAGYDAGYKTEKNKVYNATIDQAMAEGRFRRNFDLGFRIVCTGIAAGYLLQYVVFYILRRMGILPDVDSMLLPEGSSEGIDGEVEPDNDLPVLIDDVTFLS